MKKTSDYYEEYGVESELNIEESLLYLNNQKEEFIMSFQTLQSISEEKEEFVRTDAFLNYNK